MTKAERAEFVQMLSETLNNFKQIEALERELLNQTLIRIEKKLDVTTEAVTDHTKQLIQIDKMIVPTVETCAQRKKIDTMFTEMVTNKTLKKTLVTAVVILGIVLGMVNVLIGMLKHV